MTRLTTIGWALALATGCDAELWIEPTPDAETHAGGAPAEGGGGNGAEPGAAGGIEGSADWPDASAKPPASKWESASETPIHCDRHTASPLGDGRVLIVGPCSLADGEPVRAVIYDYEARTFEPVPLDSDRNDHAATVLNDGRVAIVGDGDEVLVFDPEIGSFEVGPTLIERRTWPTVVTLGNGAVWVIGGFGEDGEPLASTEILRVEENWAMLGPTLLEPRAGAAAIAVRGCQVFVAGGQSTASDSGYAPQPSSTEFAPCIGCDFEPRDPVAGDGWLATADGTEGSFLVSSSWASWVEGTTVSPAHEHPTMFFPVVAPTADGRFFAAGFAGYSDFTDVIELHEDASATSIGSRQGWGPSSLTEVGPGTLLLMATNASLLVLDE